MGEVLRWTVTVTGASSVSVNTSISHSVNLISVTSLLTFILVFPSFPNLCLSEKHPTGLAGSSLLSCKDVNLLFPCLWTLILYCRVSFDEGKI